MRTTKKQMVEEYPKVKAERDLLDLYLFDSQNGGAPDATEIYGTMRGQLFRASGGAGGYVVIWHIPDYDTNFTGNAQIHYLDEWNSLLRDNHSEHTLALRVLLERLTVARNRIAFGAYKLCTGCGASVDANHVGSRDE